MSEIGSRPYPEPFGEIQKLVAEPVWLGVNEVELMDLAQTFRAVAAVERAKAEEVHSHAGSLEDNHSGGGPDALRRDAALLEANADRCDKAAAILEEAAVEAREAKVDISVLGAYAQNERESWQALLKETANARWAQKLAGQSLETAQDAARARADKAEAFFTAKLRELADQGQDEQRPAPETDTGDLDGPRVSRHAELSAEPQPGAVAEAGKTGLEAMSAESGRPVAHADAFEQHKAAWAPQSEPEPRAPAWDDEQSRREREQPVNFGESAGHTTEAGSPGVGATEAMSGTAVHDTESGSTDLQAGGVTAPGETLEVNLPDSDDTAAQAAAAQTMMNPGLMGQGDTAYRAPNAHGYHGGDGLYGDRRADELPMDHESRLARWAKWLQAQPPLFDARGLAVGGVPRYVLAMHVDSEGGEHVFLYSNIGPGLLAVRLPLGVWPGWEHAADPQNQDRAVLARMLGHEDPVWAASAHYVWLRDRWAAQGLRYHLVGMAVTYALPEPESARRAVQPLNDHLKDVDAPFLVEAAGPITEPADGTAHPLQFTAPALYTRIEAVLATPWAAQARDVALGWVAEIVEGSGVEDWDGFAAVVREIAQHKFVALATFNAASRDGAQIAAQTWRNHAHAVQTPAERRTYLSFMGFLAYHRALVGLAALMRWGHAQTVKDPGFVHDLAYLTLKAKEMDNDPALAARMVAQLPDPGQSPWRPR